MIDIELVNGTSEGMSQAKLQSFYDRGWLPAEKKTYLTKLSHGMGPYLPTEKDQFLLDASSQIATLGFGFNASPLFGTGHHLESWWNRKDTMHFQGIRRSFTDFLKRKAGWCTGDAFFCNSGAEGNEIALGHAFINRRSHKQRKVLAFRGSFHGRFLLALTSTWNPSKRVESEWPSFTSEFCDLPEMKNDHTREPKIPKGWRGLWAEASAKNFLDKVKRTQKDVGQDALFDSECAALLQVREVLQRGEIFAVLAEPLQCEGGDRYSSARYHNGLINLCQAYGVPLIYDEVQTGFGLGGPFFWHRLFDLRNEDGASLFPDYIVMAKKAQLGVVLSHQKIEFAEQFAAHSLIRGYLQGMAIDQSRKETAAIEKLVRKRNKEFVAKFTKHLESPRTQGLAFSFDFKEKELLDKFIQVRFTQGLMYYPAGSNTARFRLNLSYGEDEIRLLFANLTTLMDATIGSSSKKVEPKKIRSWSEAEKIRLHRDLVDSQWSSLEKKLSVAKANSKAEQRMLDAVAKTILGKNAAKLELVLLTKKNLSKHDKVIQKLQRQVYEPIRRTDSKTFADALNSPFGVGIAVYEGKKLAAIAIAGSLESFPLVSGVRSDFLFETKTAAYSSDVTVAPDCQGMGLGTFLKFAILELVTLRGASVLQGRNRDQHAANMVKVNLSFGAITTQYLRKDYPDSEKHGDAIYYSIPLRWRRPNLNMSLAVDSPWEGIRFPKNYRVMAEQYLYNKMCLSNFVSGDFLCALELIAEHIPESMRRFYTTSGQSECVDKIVKSIWQHRKIERLLSFEGGFFGHGSMLSRGLSGLKPSFYPVEILPQPTNENFREILAKVEAALAETEYQSVWVEPMGQHSMERIPIEFLKGLRTICTKAGVKLVSNDTGGQFGRYDSQCFLPSALFAPDASFVFLGGQMGLCYFQADSYVDKPLAMISTWDGDEYSLQAYAYALQVHKKEHKEWIALEERFATTLKKLLHGYENVHFHGLRAYGWIEGNLPLKIAEFFAPRLDRKGLLVCPTFAAMERFVAMYGERS